MNNLDKQYQALLQDILDNGHFKSDRTGTGTISVFGRQIRHKMSEGFPLITTKKMYSKGIITELLWFLRGETNIKSLVENDCNIWNGDAYKKYLKWAGYDPLNMEQFIEKIKTDSDFAGVYGNLGPIYGKQWRSWDAHNNYDIDPEPIDQIQNAINDLKTNPDSRRIIVSAWNVADIDKMTLPPCHNFFQFYTRKLDLNERRKLVTQLMYNEIYTGSGPESLSHSEIDQWDVPTRAISLMWNQRSVDTFLGLPFNIASYGLLLEIVAKMVNMIPEELIGNLGDTHLYSNHIDQAKEQIGELYTHEERKNLLKDAMNHRIYNKTVNELMPFGGGMSEYYESYNIPRRSREPYPLPKLGFNKSSGFFKELGNDLTLFNHLDASDFMIENYKSYPTIKAPLSN